MDLPDLRARDVLTLLAVRRRGTVTGAAREMRVTPSQVSKSIARVERQLGMKLVSRTSRGMIISEPAQRVMPHLEEIVSRLRQLPLAKAGPLRQLTVAAPSWLIQLFLPLIAEAEPETRLRGLQLGPAEIRHEASNGLFELALTSGVEALPSPWVSTPVGRIRKSLFASPALARRLGLAPLSVEALKEIPFVCPIFAANGEFVPVDDDCPLAYSERRVGHQVVTFGLALEMAAKTDQLVFGPVIAAAPYLEDGLLQEVPVGGWDVSEVMQLCIDGDKVLAKTQRALLASLRKATQRLT